MLFQKTFILSILALCLIFSHSSFGYGYYSQYSTDSAIYKHLDSLFKDYEGKYTEEAYVNHIKILKKSKEISYLKRELEAYKSLAWYHGHGHVKEKNLDSTLFYFDRYESRINQLDTIVKSQLEIRRSIAGHFLNKGNILANQLGLVEHGLEAYFKAYPYIEEGNTSFLITYYTFLSQIYMFKDQIDKSIEIMVPYIKDTASMGMLRKLYFMQTLAKSYQIKELPEKSLSLNKQIIKIAKKENNDYFYWWAKNQMAYDYFLLGAHEKAIDSALTIRKYYTKNVNRDALFNNSVYLTTFYHAAGNLDSALLYAEDAIKYPNSTPQLETLYKRLISLYKEKKDINALVEIYTKKDQVTDSIRAMEESLIANYTDANIKLIKEKQINQKVKYENQLLEEKNTKQQLLIIGIVIMSLSAFALFYLYQKYRKGRQEIGKLKTNEKKLLEEQIKLRENELDASALTISKKMEVLHVVQEKLEGISSNDSEKLEQVNTTIKNLITSSSDISIITDRIESQYPAITVELKDKHPELSETEIRYCLLTKLNLSLKETAMMLNVTPNTVKVTRSRLKKKIGIAHDVSLKSYLDQIDISNNGLGVLS